jgi:SPP1 gp7 family putative phage head morphogenesis protein
MKSLEAILTQEYQGLQSTELTLQKQLRSLFETEAVELGDIVDIEFLRCTENGMVKFAKLSEAITSAEARLLQESVDYLQDYFPDAVEFPFSVLSFDRMNRLEGMKAKIISQELETAIKEYELLRQHLMKQAERVLYDLLDEYEMEPRSFDIEEIAENKAYPLLQTVYKNHMSESQRIIRMVSDAIIRNDNAMKTAEAVENYSENSAYQSAMRVAFTEGTRVTTECAKEIFKDTGLKYFTVYVDDGKACEVCVGIAKTQAVNPVDFKDMVVGVNAPPYHPYCRCHIEIANYKGVKIESKEY